MQDVVNILANWILSGKISIYYYHFILICDILRNAGIIIDNSDIGLKYIAGYLLLSKVEEITSINIEHCSCEMSQKVDELIYTAIWKSL